MMIRLALCGLIAGCLLALVMIVAFRATALETIQYDTLTCEELAWGYAFNTTVMRDMLAYHDGCVDFADSPASIGPNDMLSCRFIWEHGMFVQGIVNDISDVYKIKCADG